MDPFREGYERELDRLKGEFVTALRSIADETLVRAATASLAGMGLPDGYLNTLAPSALVYANDGTFSVKDHSAISFLRYQSFAMSTIEGEKITQAMKDTIGRLLPDAVSNGMSRNDFKNEVQKSLGIGAKGYHLETVWRNNVGTASTASKLMAMERAKGQFPAWEFMAITDGDTTPVCTANDGRKFRADDRSMMPPLHHNCRSEASPIDATEFEDEGYAIDTPADVPVPEGFRNTAVENFESWVASEAKASPAIAKALKAAPKPEKANDPQPTKPTSPSKDE